jgi:hypothetical protein
LTGGRAAASGALRKENQRMKRTMGGWLSCGIGLLALASLGWPARAAGLDDFKLTKVIPADAMIVVDTRDHPGKEFVDKQFQRVWEAVEKQNFDRDIKRLIRGSLQEQGEDVDKFDTQWQQITDLAARVTWSKLGEREFAFAMSLVPPVGTDFVMLMMPPADQVAPDFEGLTAILKNLVSLAPQGELVLSTEGEGESVVHKLTVPNPMSPVSFTLARHKDVLLMGMGPTMVEQSLALLRGQSDAATAALASSERFQQAFKRLPPPADALRYMDLARLMSQARNFAQMGAQMAASLATSQPTEGTAGPGPFDFLPKIVDQFDLWDYVASVSTTDGMKTTKDTTIAVREEGRTRPLFKALYGNGPLRDPLKFVPKEATGVSVSNGIDFAAFYKTVLDFIDKEVPQGKDLLEQWKQQQQTMDFNVETDLLSWLGGGFAKFNATRGSAYVQDWALILEVRDEAKGNQALDKLVTKLDEYLVPNNGGVEDAKLEGAPGFKRVILPAFLALLPIGRPVFGIQDGHLFLASSPEIVTTALDVAAGKHDNFSKSERFVQEGLPLGQNVTGVSFEDLSHRGEELGQMLGMVGLVQAFLPAEAQKHPAVVTILSMVTKIGRVVKTLDFYKSSCSVSTFDGKATTVKEVTNYQEPPKPKPTTQETGEEGAKPAPARQ